MHPPNLEELRAIYRALQNGTRSPRPITHGHFICNIAANMIARADGFEEHVNAIVGKTLPAHLGFNLPPFTYTEEMRARALVSVSKMRADGLEFARVKLSALVGFEPDAPDAPAFFFAPGAQLPIPWESAPVCA